jgi:hypothetical protein
VSIVPASRLTACDLALLGNNVRPARRAQSRPARFSGPRRQSPAARGGRVDGPYRLAAGAAADASGRPRPAA